MHFQEQTVLCQLNSGHTYYAESREQADWKEGTMFVGKAYERGQ